MIGAVGTPGLEIPRGQRTQMRTHGTQYPLISSGQALQPIADRHPTRTHSHERRGNLPKPPLPLRRTHR